jgi:hypothetical protein
MVADAECSKDAHHGIEIDSGFEIFELCKFLCHSSSAVQCQHLNAAIVTCCLSFAAHHLLTYHLSQSLINDSNKKMNESVPALPVTVHLRFPGEAASPPPYRL